MNPNSPKKSELKIKVIRFFEIAYDNNGQLTTAIVKSGEPFTLSITPNGTATLSGKAGHLSFNVSEETKSFGFDFRFVSLHFRGTKDKQIQYSATFNLGYISIHYFSNIDVKNLILSCSGLLCIAARAMKNRFKLIDQSIKIQTQ